MNEFKIKIEKLRGGEETLKKRHKIILSAGKLPDYDIFAEMERNIYVDTLGYELSKLGLNILAKLTVRKVKKCDNGEVIAFVTPFHARKDKEFIINVSHLSHILLIA